MRITRHKSNVIEPDMTPMIDIVFQLIAFFMIVTNFEQTQADERVKLPADELARPPLAPREQELVLNMGFIRTPEGVPTHQEPLIFRGGAATSRSRISARSSTERPASPRPSRSTRSRSLSLSAPMPKSRQETCSN